MLGFVNKKARLRNETQPTSYDRLMVYDALLIHPTMLTMSYPMMLVLNKLDFIHQPSLRRYYQFQDDALRNEAHPTRAISYVGCAKERSASSSGITINDATRAEEPNASIKLVKIHRGYISALITS